MIGHLEGRIAHKGERLLILDVGGVGYEVEVPSRVLDELPEIGATQRLVTHMLVREDAYKLFGFLDIADRDAFRVLLRSDGVGPAMAIALLSEFTPAELAEHARTENISALSRVPGVGNKTARRLCFNLKDKLSTDIDDAAGAGVGQAGQDTRASGIRDSVTRTLVQQLGFKTLEAKQLVAAVVTPEMDFEQALQAALRASSRGT